MSTKTDFCTGVSEWYADCCAQHDKEYANPDIKRREADGNFRRCIQKKSPFGIFSPMSWWRWAGVRVFGWWFRRGSFDKAAEKERKAASDAADASGGEGS